jgi:hypothetical protein
VVVLNEISIFDGVLSELEFGGIVFSAVAGVGSGAVVVRVASKGEFSLHSGR